jgi:hypothetical protein
VHHAAAIVGPMHRIALVAWLAHTLFEPPADTSRPFRPHAHRAATLRPAPDARPLTGVRKARRGDRRDVGLPRPVARRFPVYPIQTPTA